MQREGTGKGACAEANIWPIEIHELLVEQLIAFDAINVLQKCVTGSVAAFS